VSFLKLITLHFIQTIFAKGAHYAIEELSKLDYNVVGLDWTIDPEVARKLAAPGTVFQGNLDPVALFGDKVSYYSLSRKL